MIATPGHARRTLGEIVRVFKAVTTRQIRLAGVSHFGWQRNYWEHVIRNAESLDRIRDYIASNPARWLEDKENPRNPMNQEGAL